jgi:hypothetical protein
MIGSVKGGETDKITDLGRKHKSIRLGQILVLTLSNINMKMWS